jgi:hypothetical protein
MDDLKEKLKGHYHDAKLSEGQLSRLEGLQSNKRAGLFNWSHYAAASLVIALIFTFYPKESNLQKIANEVIYNHKKNLPSEYLVNEFLDLNQRLLKLDFKVKSSPQLAHYEVVGGRYCSIQGNTAAQIKIKYNGITSTLYQSNFTDVNKEELPFQLNKDGVNVMIWVEGGLLFAKATDQ